MGCGESYPTINVKVVEAKKVPKMDVVGKSDPYCILKVNCFETEFKTKVINNTEKPKWDQDFNIPYKDLTKNKLNIQMFDQDSVSKDDPISFLEIPLSSISADGTTDQWYEMSLFNGVKPIKEGKMPKIHLKIKFNSVQ